MIFVRGLAESAADDPLHVRFVFAVYRDIADDRARCFVQQLDIAYRPAQLGYRSDQMRQHPKLLLVADAQRPAYLAFPGHNVTFPCHVLEIKPQMNRDERA